MRNPKIILPAIGILIVAALGILLLNPGAPCCAETGSVQDITPTDYQDQFVAASTTHLLLDVRTPEEFATGHIQGAVNIPVQSLESRLSEVPDDQPIVVYCRSGNRSAQASQILVQAGYNGIYDLGGVNDWVAQGLPLQ